MFRTVPNFLLAFLTALLPVIFDSALKGTVLLAFVGLAVVCMSSASAATRHLAWMLGIIGVLLLPLLAAVLPEWRVLPHWVELPVSTPSGEVRSAARPQHPMPRDAAPATLNWVAVMAPSSASKDHSFAERSADDLFPVRLVLSDRNRALWFSAGWISVAALLILRLSVSALLLRMRSRAATAVTEGRLLQALEAACLQLRVSQRVRLFVDERRIVPLVWGVLRPRLVLPAQAREWEPSRLRAVLLHELAHVKRRDVLVMLLTQVACAVHWFNPLAWLAAWRLHVERERACDDLVLTCGVRPSDYAEHLLHVATQLEAASPAGALAMARPSRLEGRLTAVLNQQLKRGSVTGSIALVAAAVGLGIIVPVAMLRAQDNPQRSSDAEAVGSGEVIHRSVEAQPATPGEAALNPMIPATADDTVQHATQADRADTTKSKDLQKVPILGDIPLLGRLFRVEADASETAAEEKPVPPLQDGAPRNDEPAKTQHVIDVKADGSLTFDAAVIPYEGLAEKLTTSGASDPTHAMTVRAEKSAPYTSVAKVLEACRSAAIANVTIATNADDQTAKGPGTRQSGKSAKVDPAVELARARLDQAARELERVSELHKQKLVSAGELDRARAEVEVLRAELAGDAAGVMRIRVQQAEHQVQRLSELNKLHLASQAELDRAKAEMEIARAELTGNATEVMRIRLRRAEQELERVSELNKQKLVSQQELERAKFDVDLRRAELAGDPQQAQRTQLQQAQNELERLRALYEQKLVSQQELEQAKANVDLRMAEVSGDRALAARAGLKRAEAELDRASKLHAQKLISNAEYDALKYNLEIARAQLEQETSGARAKASAGGATSVESLRLLDEEIKLANERLALLKRRKAEAESTKANPDAPATAEPTVASKWQPFSPERLEQAIKAGRPVFVAFTADWSIDSKATEARVLNTPAVSSAFESRNVLPLKADWTRQDPVVTEWLRKFGKTSIPLYLLYMPGHAEPHLFPETLTSDEILRQLSEIKN